MTAYDAMLSVYPALPTRALNRAFRRVAQARLPERVMQSLISRWAGAAEIPLEDFEPGPFASLQDFFVRRLAPGARPISNGFVAPVDAEVIAEGPLDAGVRFPVKRQWLSAAELTATPQPAGGHYAVMFLRPEGYHWVHAPLDLRVTRIRWIPGRFFPQNQRSQNRISRIYGRNERAVLTCESAVGPLVLVLVAASMVGDIELSGVPQREWMTRDPLDCSLSLQKGEPFGHFRFGSTLVILSQQRLAVAQGERLKVGQAIAFR